MLRNQQQFDLVAARISQAEAKTTSLKAKNTYTTELDTFAADAKLQGDPSTYPQRLRDYDTQLRQRIGKDLPPGARDLFTVEAGERFSTVNREAEHFRVVSTLKSGEVAVDEAVAQYIRGVVGNANPEDVSQRTVSILKTLQDFEALGILARGDGVKRYRVAQDAIQDEETDRYTALEPGRMLDHLTAIQRGHPGDANLPIPPPLKLAEKLQKAQAEVDQQIVGQQRRETQAQQTVTRGQTHTEVGLFTHVRNAQTLNDLTALERHIQGRAADPTAQGIDAEGQRRLTTAVDAQRRRLESGEADGARQVSDATARRKWQILAGENQGTYTPRQLMALSTAALTDPGLAGDDATRFAADFQTQLDASHVSKLTGYSDAVQRLNDGFRVTGLMGYDEEGQRQEIAARQVFHDRLGAVVQTTGRRAAEQQMRGIEDEVLQEFSKSLMGAVRTSLAQPPPVPPGLYRTPADIESMNDTDIQERYTEGVANIRQAIRDGLPQAHGYAFLEALSQRRTWELAYWKDQRKQGKGKPGQVVEPAAPAALPRWWERQYPWADLSPRQAPPPAAPPAGVPIPQTPNELRESLQQQQKGP